jgi:DNA-binding GntR family transcriptional regulator
MTLDKPKPLTKQERAYRAIRERILDGSYGPGYRIVIDSLADELSISALPVREAIRRLEAEGLVVYRANAGAQVAPAEPGVFEEEATVLALLEGYATALAAPHLDEADIQRLRDVNASMVEAMEELDPLRFGRLNHEFHALINDHCPNAALLEMLRELARRLDAKRRTVFVHIPYRGKTSVAEHDELIELLARRAPAAEVEAAARNHKLNTVQSFRAWYEEQKA